VTSLLFSESPSRIIVSFAQAAIETIKEIAARHECPFTILGETNGSRLQINFAGETVVDLGVGELEDVWQSSLSGKLTAAAVAAGNE